MPDSDISVHIETNHIPEVLRQLRERMDDAVQAVGRMGETRMKDGMRDTPKREDGTSQPGGYSAIDSSALVNSVNLQPVQDMVWDLHWGTEYAAIQEFGIPGRMAARPNGMLTAAYMKANGGRIIARFMTVDI